MVVKLEMYLTIYVTTLFISLWISRLPENVLPQFKILYIKKKKKKNLLR